MLESFKLSFLEANMHILVIGGTGHIGSFLVPRLVSLGHEVTVAARGQRGPYVPHAAWQFVKRLMVDRQVMENDGTFGREMLKLRPDVVMDLTCYTQASAQQLVEALRSEVQLLVHCGTVWVRGYGVQVPAREEQPRNPITEYGRLKNAAESYLLNQAQRNGFPVTALHPGHIVGPGWAPVGPTACHDLQVFRKLALGQELALPNLGLETLHHVHADDVAQAFVKAFLNPQAAIGQGFFIVSESALSLRGFAEAVAGWFGRQANLRFLPLDEWTATLSEAYAESANTHLAHSTNCSIEKAQRLLGYAPRYTSLEAVYESIQWLIEHGEIKL
jgi:nucleoside-diphosphate-sugar epimerase